MTILTMLIPFIAVGLIMAVFAILWGYYKGNGDESWVNTTTESTELGGDRT